MLADGVRGKVIKIQNVFDVHKNVSKHCSRNAERKKINKY
jgi:hypothetical protein